jgi:hypothetical protein
MHGVTVGLPRGHWIDGVCHRQAQLRPLTGEDEAFLFDSGEFLLPAQRTTALLARCLVQLGPLQEVTPDTVRSLTVGDREALLLQLRRLTLGDRLQSVLSCPRGSCGKKMDLELKTDDVLVPPYSSTDERHQMTVADNGANYTVFFRPLTGTDVEAAASVARTDLGAAADQLLRRCVVSVDCDNGQPVDELPAVVTETLPARLSEADPQAELMLDLTCPECGQGFTALLDVGTYFFQEIAAGIRRLYRDVHLLAFYYHWSEAEILGMTCRKRQRYLGLLAEALGK